MNTNQSNSNDVRFNYFARGIIQIGGALIACLLFFIVLKAIGAPKNTETDILIQQFHLPKGSKFDLVEVNRKNRLVNPPTIEAYAKFSEAEFLEYQGSLNNPDFWKSQPIQYDGQVFNGAYAPDALKWDEYQATNMVSWGAVSATKVQEAKNAKAFCFVARYPSANGAALAPYDAARCSNETRSLESGLIVQGLLDEGNRTLHMLVRGVRPKN